MEKISFKNWGKSIAAQGGILVFFIMAFEVMIMISPFAFFFLFGIQSHIPLVRCLSNDKVAHTLFLATYDIATYRTTKDYSDYRFRIIHFGFHNFYHLCSTSLSWEDI